MHDEHKIKIFTCKASRDFAEKVAMKLGLKLGESVFIMDYYTICCVHCKGIFDDFVEKDKKKPVKRPAFRCFIRCFVPQAPQPSLPQPAHRY